MFIKLHCEVITEESKEKEKLGIEVEPEYVECYVNVDHVDFFYSNGNGTTISMGDEVIHVAESCSTVAKKIAEVAYYACRN